MYHCCMHFYLAGRRCKLFEVIKEMSPLEAFVHDFSESEEPEKELTEKADVILANLQGMDVLEAVETLTVDKRKEAELILLTEKDEISLLGKYLPEIKDIWLLPMSEEEVRFRFLRWQQTCKLNKELWQTNQYLETTINSSPNLIWYKDRSGIHEKVNESFCRTVNKTKQQVEGSGHAYIWNVEGEDPACIESEQEVMNRRETCISGEKIQTGEGERLLTTYKSPLYDLDGSIMGTVGIAIDVTQERSYEMEIIKRNEMLETILTAIDCGVLYHTLDGSRLLSINRAALEILGYESKEEMLNDGFSMVAMTVADEDKPRLREGIQRLKKVGDSFTVEYRVIHKDGKVVDVMGTIKLVEENGELFCQRFLLDCTAQKQREKEERMRKDQKIEYQQQLFDIFSTYLSKSRDDVYLMLHEDGKKVEYVSPNVERVLGVSQESVEKDLRKFGRAKYINRKQIEYEDLLNLTPGNSLEIMETERINPKTGEHRWFRESVYCSSIQNEKKIVIYISDRTKERKTQDALAEALEIAEVANKAKSTFLSSVSHDIRTPMNAIMGLVTLLKDESDNPERVKEYIQKISAASQHLVGLINDVLDMNKIESGNTTLNISDMNLAEVISDLNTIIRTQANTKGQSFEIVTSSLTYENLLGDKMRLNQILINILSNAVKYTQEGGRIKMEVLELPQVNEKFARLQFIVSDNGQGMSEEYLKVIFNPFTREQATLTNQIQGTGLGMAITKRLVDLMGGTIKVQSVLGKGSTFTVDLELRIQEKEVDPDFWKNNGISRMLVVDDEEDICANVIQAMSGTGVITSFVTDGRVAVDNMCDALERGEPYDLVLLDWKMAGVNGLETANLIKERYKEKMPILLFTAYDWSDIEEEAQKAGIFHFLSKPFFMNNFKLAVRQIAEGKRKPANEKTQESVMKGKKILVVDDMEINRMILVRILDKLGAECVTADNGKEALQAFESSEPDEYDIIFMDIQMPVMDGYESTRAIRASSHPSAKSVSIIAMTANAFVDDVQNSLESGMDAHVAKPIVLDLLQSTVQEVLDRKAQAKG